jgi:hypothetical protein
VDGDTFGELALFRDLSGLLDLGVGWGCCQLVDLILIQVWTIVYCRYILLLLCIGRKQIDLVSQARVVGWNLLLLCQLAQLSLSLQLQLLISLPTILRSSGFTNAVELIHFENSHIINRS